MEMTQYEYSILDDDEFEVFDVLHANGPPPLIPHTTGSHVVYIDKTRYDQDLLRGQEHAVAAYTQISKDIPRSTFFMNGRISRRVCADLPLTLLRYCTQAVMGLPLELLHSSSVIVAERRQKRSMRICATDQNVHVTKELQVLDDATAIPVEITVHADVRDPIVIVTYRFDAPLTC